MKASNTTLSKRKSRNGRSSVRANLDGTVRPAVRRVDFKAGELKLTKRPIRPAKWKPKKRFIGKMTIKLSLPDNVRKGLNTKITIVSPYRLYKSNTSHIELTRNCNKRQSAAFDKVPESHYIVLVQAKGHRPYPTLVRFTEKQQRITVRPILHPVEDEQQQDVLLYMGERHPYITPTRQFLLNFGYLQTKSCQCRHDELCKHLSNALSMFQETYKLKRVGELTLETFLLMQRPRCGHPDIPIGTPMASSAGPTGTIDSDPIVFMGGRWDDFDLRYKELTGTGDISNEWSIIRVAMDRWAQASPLTFRRVSSGSSEIEFDFRRPSESDYPFERGGTKGSGNILAHAWGPLNGLVEFDDYEDWGSTSLAAVATHEIGHALGLAHSSVESATMYALYSSGQASLHEVDVRGIKSLYAPVYRHNGPFVAYPLYAFQSEKGTDSVTIDLGQTRHFLAWGTINMIDSLIDLDRDNMHFIDIYEVDGNRTGWRISGGDHFGGANSPANVYEGARVGYGRKITFRITAGHVGDLEVSGFAIVLVLD